MASSNRVFLRIVFIFFLMCVFTPSAFSQPFNASNPVRVGVLLDSSNEVSANFVKRLKEEVASLLGNQYLILVPESKQFVADWSHEKTQEAYQNLSNDNEVDVIVVAGAYVSAVIAQLDYFTKPSIVFGIIDDKLQGIKLTKARTSGIKNLSYILEPHEFKEELANFHEIFPYQKLAVVVDKKLSKLIPNLEPRLNKLISLRGSQGRVYYYDGDVTALINSFSKTSDAVLLGNLISMPSDQKQLLIDHINRLKLPSYSYKGIVDVDAGILAGSMSEANWQKVCRRIALNIERVLNGENPAEFSTLIKLSRTLTINMHTANKIDFSPNWQTLAKADQIAADKIRGERTLTLESVIQEALQVNLGLSIERQSVAAAIEDVTQARAAMFPSLQLTTSAAQIDEDHAGVVQPEKIVNGSIGLNQVLFSEPLMANLAVQKYGLNAANEAFRETVLDTILSVGQQFLGILQAQANERVSRNNLKLVRKNYEVAEYRRRVGYAGGADVFRLESELATATSNLLSTQNLLWQAKIDLNESLQRPLDEEFSVTEVYLESNLLRRYGGDKIHAAVKSPKALNILTQFLVTEALGTVPELEQLRQLLAAQERILASNKRRRWLPTFSFNATVNEVLNRSGVGADGDYVDDTSWNLGALASWSLYEGGGISSEVRQARVEKDKLHKQIQEAGRGIELQLRKAVLNLRVLSADLKLSRSAAEAAEKNYVLVQDSYEHGAATITSLLDAQNSALLAVQSAANSVYNYFSGVLQVERALGSFSVTNSLSAQQDFFDRYQQFMAEKP